MAATFKKDLNDEQWRDSCIGRALKTGWPYLAIYWTLGNFLKPLATINFPKSPTFLCNFSSEIILGNFYRHLPIFSGHTDYKTSDVLPTNLAKLLYHYYVRVTIEMTVIIDSKVYFQLVRSINYNAYMCKSVMLIKTIAIKN